MWLDFDPQSEDDETKCIWCLKEMTNFVPVKETGTHTQEKRSGRYYNRYITKGVSNAQFHRRFH